MLVAANGDCTECEQLRTVKFEQFSLTCPSLLSQGGRKSQKMQHVDRDASSLPCRLPLSLSIDSIWLHPAKSWRARWWKGVNVSCCVTEDGAQYYANLWALMEAVICSGARSLLFGGKPEYCLHSYINIGHITAIVKETPNDRLVCY